MADSIQGQQLATQQGSGITTGGAGTALQGQVTASGAPSGGFIQLQHALVNNRRGLLFIAGSLMLVGFLGLILWSSEVPYRALHSGMSEKDAAAVIEVLQKEHIPYKLEGTGTVLVPADKVYSTRLKLASQDMMPGTGTGFEIFDRSNEFGISDFTQKINLQRALQGELARTIEVFPQVSSARVHLVMPKESAFTDRDRHATASVMLQMVGHKHMPKSAVEAIQNLVSGSVPELDKSAVTVVDSSGTLLSAKNDEQPAGEGETMQLYQSNLEKSMERKLTTMLEQVVGAGQAVVRVSAKVNREYVEQNSKRFNPDEQVMRSQQVNEEKRTSSQSMPTGVPGVASNTPGSNPAVLADGSIAAGASASNQSGEQASKREQTNNYEISSTTEHKIIPFGSLERLSVAVIVGGHFDVSKNGDKTFVPRSKAELKGLQTLVKGAIGFDEDRGDSVELQSMPLLDIGSGLDTDGLASEGDKSFYLEVARYGLVALALILLAWFLLRPLAQRMNSEKDEAFDEGGQAGGYPALSEEASKRLAKMTKAREAVIHNPERAGKVLREWVGST